MSKFQLWSRDEYGQGSILFTHEDIHEVIKEAKARVTDINVNNALTSSDRERNWEAFLPFIISGNKRQNSQNIFMYGGKGPLNKDLFFALNIKTGKTKEITLDDIPKPIVDIYLGNIGTQRDEKTRQIKPVAWFAKDARSNAIHDLGHQDLEKKTIFFVKPI